MANVELRSMPAYPPSLWMFDAQREASERVDVEGACRAVTGDAALKGGSGVTVLIDPRVPAGHDEDVGRAIVVPMDRRERKRAGQVPLGVGEHRLTNEHGAHPRLLKREFELWVNGINFDELDEYNKPPQRK